MAKHSTNKLSDPAIKAAKPKDKIYSLPDGGGLRLFISPSNNKSWRYNYRINGKNKSLTLGRYPDVSLKAARELCSEARQTLAKGIDPAEQKQVKRQELGINTFQAIAETWIERNRAGWSETHYKRTESYLRRDAYPAIGMMPMDEIGIQHLIRIVENVAGRGAVASAKRMLPLVGQIFQFAIVQGVCERNPANDVSVKNLGLPKTIKKHFKFIKDPVRLGELLRAIDDYSGGLSVRAALQLAPMFGMRPTEISGGEWSEIDFEKAVWTVPARRRKLEQHRKNADLLADVHRVPLSRQALAILHDLHQYTGRGKYVFAGTKPNSPIASGSIYQALRRMGFHDQTTHGFRHTASTLLNGMGYRERLVESQLSHSLKSQVEAAYNHSDYLEERREMMQAWADYLESIKEGGAVIPFKRNQA